MKTFSTASPIPRPLRRRSAVEAVPAAKAVSDGPLRRAATGLNKRRTGAGKGTALTPPVTESTRGRLLTGLNWSEATIQRQVFKTLDLLGVEGLIYWHVANGDPSARRRLWKAQLGEKSGMPDVMLYSRGKLYCLELKKLGGRVSDEQYEMMDRFRTADAEVGIAYGYPDAIAHLERWRLIKGRMQ